MPALATLAESGPTGCGGMKGAPEKEAWMERAATSTATIQPIAPS
jgi:hypothetical protein